MDKHEKKHTRQASMVTPSNNDIVEMHTNMTLQRYAWQYQGNNT